MGDSPSSASPCKYHTAAVTVVHQHPTRPVIVWAAGNRILAYNFRVGNWEPAHRVRVHTAPIRSLDYAGGFWISASEDKTVAMYKDESFEHVRTWTFRKKLTYAIFRWRGSAESVVVGDSFGEVVELLAGADDATTTTACTTKPAATDPTARGGDGEPEEEEEEEEEEDGSGGAEGAAAAADNDDDDDQTEGLVFGNYSPIDALLTSADQRYLIATDRGHHIVVSCLATPILTLGYCMGHRGSITSVLQPAELPGLLVTVATDCTLRLWQLPAGEERGRYDLSQWAEDAEAEAAAAATTTTTRGHCHHPIVPIHMAFDCRRTCFFVAFSGCSAVAAVEVRRRERGVRGGGEFLPSPLTQSQVGDDDDNNSRGSIRTRCCCCSCCCWAAAGYAAVVVGCEWGPETPSDDTAYYRD
eukprot:GHVU01235649.1.p1 GENE.GHVU01235649.1~~GHVU01235649.1.p1  ORF type:complete len:452 (+),score=90.31 GHVU01235649.1:117-1358(+)